MEESVTEGIAWQIKMNRKKRGLSQSDLGKLLGNISQSAVARYEDPTYGKHSLDTLKKIANAFECALSVKLISYAQLAAESENLGPESLLVDSFSDQIQHLRR